MRSSLKWIVVPLLLVAVIGTLDRGGNWPGSVAPARAATPQELATQLTTNDAALRTAIDAWRAGGDPPSEPPPEEAMGAAGLLQEKVRFLAKHPRVAEQTIRLLPGALAAQVRHLIVAARKLNKLSGGKHRKLKTGEPPPVSELVGYYEKANRLYGIAPHYLAAIHHVETKFGRVKSKSTAGARGPMQFIPSTWRIYGKGGNIQDPHDAILAAARLLRDNGAPGSYGRALHAYNPSKLYVVAVTRYAQRIASDPYVLLYLYCWQA
ncbi:MAG: transglycosylase SLT domain-containing protein [Solirubrobacterales bacterium]